MTTLVRPEISKKNKYWIDKHRHYELKHFCLQYPTWKKEYAALAGDNIATSIFDKMPSGNIPGSPTERTAVKKASYLERIVMIERAAREADEDLCSYIIKAVTEGLSFTYLKARLEIPCSRDMYYDRYRRFFWILNESRG